VRIANIESGINTADNCIAHLPMIMLSLVPSGHLTASILQLVVLKCLGFATNQDGHIHSISQNAGQ